MRPAIITFAAKKTAAVVIAGTVVVGTGSFALAATQDDGSDPGEDVEIVEDETTDDETTDDETTDDETTDDETTDDGTTDDDTTDDGTTDDGTTEEPVDETPVHVNHGAAVSEAAHTCPKGPGHGQCVSQVARSDAGKKGATTTPAPAAPPADEPDTLDAAAEDTAPAPAARANNGKGSGKAKGKKG